MQKFTSDVSGKQFPVSEKVSAKVVRKSIIGIIQKEHPTFNEECSLAMAELNKYREKYITEFLLQELGELSNMETKVVESLKNRTVLSDKLEDETEITTFGQRVADKVATFGGSWTFIILFSIFIFGWIVLNIVFLSSKGFDPYPFILLNLILSCIAAMQAPVIMMSQNRQEEKDRERAQNDYMINLKSELEIRMLHEKLDHLILYQEQSLIEIQRVQLDMMNDILTRMEKK
ncbi:DUF1003 domain-containing protein [Flavobacterium sp. LaA7.5]|nr:DUF1003 domain-containing protein [Flavobacterium salilacus subsp. altitudinum]